MTTSNNNKPQEEKCAILFYGLPRAFDLVLPSIQRYIIGVNQPYECDYFVHYYNQTVEVAGRSGQGGTIANAHAIRRLEAAVALEYTSSSTNNSVVRFASDTNETFHALHADIIHQVLTAKDETGTRPLYYPWMERDYVFPQTMLNIIKMMHSMHQAWQLMAHYGATHGISYTRVALLRADVVFLTPVDIWSDGSSSTSGTARRDVHNTNVVIPSFARYPVNDRGIYGNATGVQIWATHRFDALAQHVQDFRNSGYVLHNERFVDTALLPAIRRQGVQVVEHDTWCFCRARVNQRVWFTDCTRGSTSPALKRAFPDTASLLSAVEQAVNGTCRDVQPEGVPGALSARCG